jgi:type I restriction enzyme R subunit
MDLCSLTEFDICDQFITPAIQKVGWDQEYQVPGGRLVTYTAGRIWARGRMATRITKRIPVPPPQE